MIKSNASKIITKFCKSTDNFKSFLIYSIKNCYKELDVAYFLLNKNLLSEEIYYKYLITGNLEILHLISIEDDILLEFFNRFEIFKKLYEKANYTINLGRVTELLSFMIFRSDCRNNLSIFKKMNSNIFHSGIDLLIIKYNKNNRNYIYYFFEVKSTITNILNCISQINDWYELNNFTEKYLLELESIKNNIKLNNNILNDKKKKILRDLEDLAGSLVNKERPKSKFKFCSCTFCHDLNHDKNLLLSKDSLLNIGFDFFF